MSASPTVILNGVRYRLNYGSRMERYVESHEGRSQAGPWVAVTEQTTDTERAAAALMVLIGSVRTIDGASISAAFYLATGVKPTRPVQVDGMALSGAAHLFASSSGGFPREVRADIAPPPKGMTARWQAALGKPVDARAIAAGKGLKIWNGGGQGVALHEELKARGIRDGSATDVYACAASRAALLRMIAAYQGIGVDQFPYGFERSIKTHWTEGAWGIAMTGIEPETGIWIRYHPDEAPVRVWPKENVVG